MVFGYSAKDWKVYGFMLFFSSLLLLAAPICYIVKKWERRPGLRHLDLDKIEDLDRPAKH
jgi:hypothetical protein